MKKKRGLIWQADMLYGVNPMSHYYEKAALEHIKKENLIREKVFGKLVGYKKVRKWIYLTIKLPVIGKHYDYEYGDFEGYLVRLEEFRLFPIWWKWVEEPIYKKVKSKKPVTINFVRYGGLTAKRS